MVLGAYDTRANQYVSDFVSYFTLDPVFLSMYPVPTPSFSPLHDISGDPRCDGALLCHVGDHDSSVTHGWLPAKSLSFESVVMAPLNGLAEIFQISFLYIRLATAEKERFMGIFTSRLNVHCVSFITFSN